MLLTIPSRIHTCVHTYINTYVHTYMTVGENRVKQGEGSMVFIDALHNE